MGVIAIDGPVAAGKTAVGRRLARLLGLRYLDTGVMYRAVTWLAQQRGTPIDDEAALGKLAAQYPVLLVDENPDQVEIAGQVVSNELRTPQVTEQVSLVARLPTVRKSLVQQQRQMGAQGNIVRVGRDIGSAVLPEADMKVFLTASPASRARRRWLELVEQGQSVEYQQVLEQTIARDDIDTRRADSPLAPAPDAYLVDTEGLEVDQVVELLLKRIDEISQARDT